MAILVQSNKKPSVSYPSQTGSIVTFNSQYAGLPLKSHKVAVTATQSGSGTPSPDNVRPISGYNAINISQSGADTSTPTVHTITIGSTVYGGEYDARTGVLTVTHGIVDLGSLTWIKDDTSYGFTFFRSSDISDMALGYLTSDCACSAYGIHTGGRGAINDGEICVYSAGQTRVIIRDDDKSSMTSGDFRSAITGVYFVYKLATPQTIQLAPCPIDTLQGVNNIWADTGDTTAQYIKIGG